MAGRPKAKIDWELVDSMLQAHCDGAGIASQIGIDAKTLYRAVERKYNVNFDLYKQQKRSEGKDLLLYKQYKVAYIDGNIAMLIFLGKQILGQSDKTETKNETISEIKLTRAPGEITGEISTCEEDVS